MRGVAHLIEAAWMIAMFLRIAGALASIYAMACVVRWASGTWK